VQYASRHDGRLVNGGDSEVGILDRLEWMLGE